MKYSQCEYCIEYVRYSTHIHTWNTTEYYAIFTLVIFYIRILLQHAFYSHPYRHVNTLEYVAFHAVMSNSACNIINYFINESVLF